MQTITFDTMPKALSDLTCKVDQILKAMSGNQKSEIDKLMTMDELINFLPEHPARQTIYGKVNNRQIPFAKHGKFLYFRKSEIENWLNNGRRIK